MAGRQSIHLHVRADRKAGGRLWKHLRRRCRMFSVLCRRRFRRLRWSCVSCLPLLPRDDAVHEPRHPSRTRETEGRGGPTTLDHGSDPGFPRSDPTCGARLRTTAARAGPGGGGPDTGMNRICAGWQAAGFPQESATDFSTATSSFIPDSLNIRGVRMLPDRAPRRGLVPDLGPPQFDGRARLQPSRRNPDRARRKGRRHDQAALCPISPQEGVSSLQLKIIWKMSSHYII